MVVCDELICIHGNALCCCNGAGLTNDGVEQPLTVGVSLNLADLQTQNGAYGVDGCIDANLLPDELIDVVVGAGVAVTPVSVAAAVAVALEKLCAGCVGQLALDCAAEVHLNAACRSGNTGAGLGHCGAENAGADDTAILGKYLKQIVVIAEAVDEGNGNGGIADYGHRILNCLLELGGLGHVDDDVDLALGLCRLSCAGVGAEAGELLYDVMILAVFFLMDDEVHAFLGYLLHVCFVAVDEDNVSSAIAKIRGKNAAGCAGTIHCNFHDYYSFTLFILFVVIFLNAAYELRECRIDRCGHAVLRTVVSNCAV